MFSICHFLLVCQMLSFDWIFMHHFCCYIRCQQFFIGFTECCTSFTILRIFFFIIVACCTNNFSRFFEILGVTSLMRLISAEINFYEKFFFLDLFFTDANFDVLYVDLFPQMVKLWYACMDLICGYYFCISWIEYQFNRYMKENTVNLK